MRVTIKGLLQAAAVVTVVFSLVSAVPLNHFAVQLFTHFRLQYLAVSVLLLLLLAAIRQPAYAAAMLLTVVLNSTFVLPWYTGTQDGHGEAALTIVQANVLSTNDKYEKVSEMLESEKPDLVVFQEVSPHWLMALAELRTEYPHSYAEARDGNFGIAMFSKVPLVSVTHVDSPPLAHPTVIAKLRLGEQLLNLVATHPTIPVSRELYNARNIQLDSLHEVLERLDGPVVLMGDLNASMWDLNYRAFEARSGLRNARTGFGVAPTWPTFMPFAMIPIDHVMVSDDIEVRDVHAGPRIGSDHRPLIVTLSL